MKINNKKNIDRIWTRKAVLTIAFTAAIMGVLFFLYISPDASITKYHIIIAISLFFIIVSVIGALHKPYYFYFDDINDVLVFRYYPIGIFNSKKNSIQIPKDHLVKFEMSKFFFGLEEKLVLYQKYRTKVAKYSPISLSAVSKKDREKLKLALGKYSLLK
jgi:hypothetical protein